MSNKNQTADSAQKGPGLGSNFTPTAPSAPSPGKHTNTKSGEPSGSNRGKQG